MCKTCRRSLKALMDWCAGMSAGIPRFVTVNLQQLNQKFQDGDQVDLDTLQQKGLLNLSGREASLPLKVCFRPFLRLLCTCFLVL